MALNSVIPRIVKNCFFPTDRPTLKEQRALGNEILYRHGVATGPQLRFLVRGVARRQKSKREITVIQTRKMKLLVLKTDLNVLYLSVHVVTQPRNF